MRLPGRRALPVAVVVLATAAMFGVGAPAAQAAAPAGAAAPAAVAPAAASAVDPGAKQRHHSLINPDPQTADPVQRV
uniref:hypothetical protein n=1 Tax=uncultured Leifsonia sp. TaxID=340359 RepID=UPI0028D55355